MKTPKDQGQIERAYEILLDRLAYCEHPPLAPPELPPGTVEYLYGAADAISWALGEGREKAFAQNLIVFSGEDGKLDLLWLKDEQ